MSSSMYSIGFSPGVSSPNSSLLDADPQLDIANSQLKGNSDSFSCRSRISNISMIFDDNDCDKRQQHKHNHDEMTMFHNSIRNGNVCLMNELIKKSKDFVLLVNSPNLDGQSALHIAVQSDNVGAIQELLEKSAVANAQDTDGNTPLHLCTAKESIRLLLEVGSANPNIPNMDGICVLHRTVERLDVASIRLLLNHFAKIDVADNINWFTPLHMALLPFNKIEKFGSKMSEVSRPIIVDLLCGELSKVEINEQDRDGNTPLHLAVQLDTIDATAIIRTLLDKGADPTIQNTRNQQPLLLLCHNNNLRQYDTFQESVHTMLHYGADPNHQSNTGCTPLHLSIYHNDIDSALQLINRSAELHLTWKRPISWIPHGDKIGRTDVLALDMVSEETSLYRLLAAINRQPLLAPHRPWCMQCESPLHNPKQIFHCQHCGRHICKICTNRSLLPDFFPKFFDVNDSSMVCIVCNNILVSRREELSSITITTDSASSLADFEF